MSAVTLPSPARSHWLRRTLVPALLVCAWATPACAQTVWELSPYRIRLILTTGHAPELGGDFRADLSAELLTRVDTLIGAAWDADVRWASAQMRRVMIRDLERVTVELLQEERLREAEEGAGEEPAPEEPAAPKQNGDDAEPPLDLDSLADKIILMALLTGRKG